MVPYISPSQVCRQIGSAPHLYIYIIACFRGEKLLPSFYLYIFCYIISNEAQSSQQGSLNLVLISCDFLCFCWFLLDTCLCLMSACLKAMAQMGWGEQNQTGPSYDRVLPAVGSLQYCCGHQRRALQKNPNYFHMGNFHLCKIVENKNNNVKIYFIST